ncbi:uncharacterized protein LOC113278618 [Papaver somniferum]|uniref:uncharacterized protein LOC113278618 n=1 Tax=Papaver somniferum TaxID=3469 RepID=UPI000E6FB141|nr:uncharacterized protein LOC113278618 [Papaver somniferum]
MAHSLASSLQLSVAAFSTRTSKQRNYQCVEFQRIRCDHQSSNYQTLDGKSETQSAIGRRILVGGFTGAILSLNVGNQSANAAQRRPPPKPPAEKKDPNVSGVTAKVLASMKRKEAMKEAVAKLRERGKKIEGASE